MSASTPSIPQPRNRNGDPILDPGLQLGGDVSHHQPQCDVVYPWSPCSSAVNISVPTPCLELVGRFGSQSCERTKPVFSPTPASQGILAVVSGPTQQPSSLVSYWQSQGLRCSSPSHVRGCSDQQCQVSTGTFPSLSPSCHHARGLLKNLFHSSCHVGGNGRWWLQQHLSSWVWGLLHLCLPAASSGVEHRNLSAWGWR